MEIYQEDWLVERFIKHLEKQVDCYDIVYQLVHAIPDREFYYPEIGQDEFVNFQKDVSEIITLVRRYHHRFDMEALDLLQKVYDQKLGNLVNIKKKLLMLDLLLQDRQSMTEMLLDLIIKYRLKKTVYRIIYR